MMINQLIYRQAIYAYKGICRQQVWRAKSVWVRSVDLSSDIFWYISVKPGVLLSFLCWFQGCMAYESLQKSCSWVKIKIAAFLLVTALFILASSIHFCWKSTNSLSRSNSLLLPKSWKFVHHLPDFLMILQDPPKNLGRFPGPRLLVAALLSSNPLRHWAPENHLGWCKELQKTWGCHANIHDLLLYTINSLNRID